MIKDDPSLNARLIDSSKNVLQPLRIIIDSHLQTPDSAKLIDLPGDTIIFTKQSTLSNAQSEAKALRDKGVMIEGVSGIEQCDLRQVIERLGELEINEVWVEAGAQLNGALLESGLVDELVIYVAPHLLGADSYGFKTAWIQPNDQISFDPWGVSPTITINSLSDLYEKLS